MHSTSVLSSNGTNDLAGNDQVNHIIEELTVFEATSAEDHKAKPLADESLIYITDCGKKSELLKRFESPFVTATVEKENEEMSTVEALPTCPWRKTTLVDYLQYQKTKAVSVKSQPALIDPISETESISILAGEYLPVSDILHLILKGRRRRPLIQVIVKFQQD